VPEPLAPNTSTRLQVPMGQTAYTFPAGSRVVLLVTSSDFPRILPHRNRMAPLWEGDPVVAHQRVLRGRLTPSRLLMPVIDGEIP
jgi:predicted acyl esterase